MTMKLKPSLLLAAAYSRRFWLAMLLCLPLSLPAVAAVATVYAELNASLFKPGQNQFGNKVPLPPGGCSRPGSGCSSSYYGAEAGLGTIKKQINRNSPDPRYHIYQAIDTTYKEVKLYSGSNEAVVKFRITAFSENYQKNSYGGYFYEELNFGNMIGSCQQVQGYNTTATYLFEWSHPQGKKSVCYKKVTTNNRYINISALYFKYELIALNPTGLDNGTYYGEVTYTVGDGQQVDLGYADYGGNRSLTIKIEATVKNEFQIRFPAGSERAALEPAGGWQGWLQQGSVPAKLSRDLGFSLSSSARFSMYLLCQYPSGGGCALRRDNGGGEVPIQVAVSMPGMYSSPGGAPASRYPLGVSRRVFQPSGQISTSAARLHFEMQQSEVASIVKQPGARYRGDVTIVFDASL